MNAIKTLSRDEMRDIKAGRTQATLSGGGTPCQVYVNNSAAGSYWSKCVSLSEAQSLYGSDLDKGGSVTGYCCESCGSGNFSKADENCN